MKIFKKLLFLICIMPTSVMLGMEEKLSEAEIAQYKQFANTRNINIDDVEIDRLTWNGFVNSLDFDVEEEKAEPQINSIYTNTEYLKYLANTKFVDFFKVMENRKGGQERAIKKLHIFFNFNKLESVLRNEIRAGFSDQINSLNEKNLKLTKENEQQKLKIAELAKQNKDQRAEVRNFQTAEKVQQSLNLEKQQNKNQRSWWQRIVPKVGVAAVMGGCMLLGAALHACFAAK